jgi:dTDP-glucose 4,6-dehydratase
MHNILITGGAGFIGSNFVRFLLENEPSAMVFTLDALTYSGSLDNLRNLPDEKRHVFIRGNICDATLVRRVLVEHAIDTIVHFAAESHVDRSILGPAQFIQTNIVGTFTLLEAAREAWQAAPVSSTSPYRFHHVSTDEVFGSLSASAKAWNETAPYDPHSPYSASKASSDHLVRSYGHTYGLPFTLSNCSNNYGPYQFPEKLVPLVILNAIEGKFIPVYGDGQQIRDWLHVQDHCEAILRILRHGQSGESYNIGGGNQPTNLTIVETICDLVDEIKPVGTSRRELIHYVKDRPGHDRRYAMDSTKIEQTLGWKATFTLETGLEETVHWYLEHPEWVTAIRKQVEYQAWLEKNYDQRI